MVDAGDMVPMSDLQYNDIPGSGNPPLVTVAVTRRLPHLLHESWSDTTVRTSGSSVLDTVIPFEIDVER
jgi:hypothetical protein